MTDSPRYQIAVLCGVDTANTVGLGARTIEINPASASLEDCLAAIETSDIAPTDMRSSICFASGADLRKSVALWATLSGFAGRALYVVDGTKQVDVSRVVNCPMLYRTGSSMDGTVPDERDEVLQIGGTAHDGVEPVSLGALSGKNSELVSRIRWAKRVRIVPPPAVSGVFATVAAVAGLRARRGQDRWPIVEVDGTYLDTEELRAAGNGARRSIREGISEATVNGHGPSERQLRLQEASLVDVAEVLSRLGCENDGDLWQCSRPWSHNHGDATPSMRVTEGRARCYVDDPEWVDALRIVVTTFGVTPDEAADILLSPEDERWVSQAKHVTAERAARAKQPVSR